MSMTPELKLLKKSQEGTTYPTNPDECILEIFKTPESTDEVTLVCDEFTSLCPITKQPDFATITIDYRPKEWCVETKSLKLYLFAYRNYGAFAETLATKIATDIQRAINPEGVQVTVKFEKRGGISIEAVANKGAFDEIIGD